MPRLLVIAGSDSSAGAGIQADLKTAQAFGVYVQTAVTAITAQDTKGVHAVEVMNPLIVQQQIKAALGDIGAEAIKIGMLGDGTIVTAVADILKTVDLPLVLDPVLVSSSGRPLLDQMGVAALKSRLLPCAFLVTPNWPECEALTGIRPDSDPALKKAAHAFAQLGARHVLIKGGHGEGSATRDVLIEEDGKVSVFESPRQQTRHTHGTGCAFSTAIACGLSQGKGLAEAVGLAHDFVQHAIRTAPDFGSGHGPLNLSANTKQSGS